MSTVLVTGASGFVGSHTIPALLRAGHGVVAFVRTPAAGETVLSGLPPADRDRIAIRVGDVVAPASLREAMAGVDAVVHLVALPRDRHQGADLRLVNTEGTRAVVVAMQASGIRRLLHMSALLNVSLPSPSAYATSKLLAEAIVRSSGLDWTILQPSTQFGESDGFFNLIASTVRLSPFVTPMPGDGRTRFQPIHADDVARVALLCLEDPTTVGSTFALGGPRAWTYRELVGEVVSALGARRAIVPVPVPLIRVVAGTAERLGLPFPASTDQLRLLGIDNTCPPELVPERFGFTPRPLEGALGYLRYGPAEQRAAMAVGHA